MTRERRERGQGKSIHRRRFLKISGAAAAFGALGPGVAFGGPAGTGGGRPPNILCIVSDEMAPGYLGCYGGEALTPHLDSLARDGVRFDEAYCVSAVCAPSRFTILTGLYPGHCTHPGFLSSQPTARPYLISWNTGITRDTPCIPRLLSEAGYYTGFVGKYGVPFADSNAEWDIPKFHREDDPDDPEVDRRLRRYHEICVERVKRSAGFDYAAGVMPGNVHNPIPELHHHQFEWITEGALEFLDRAAARGDPFFLYAATTAVHGPNHVDDLDADPRYTLEGKREEPFTCHPPRRSIPERLRAAGLPVDVRHVGMTFLDDHVGALLGKLRELGLDGNTLVLFLADHNVEPGKATCYQRGVHVPMLMKWTGRVAPGTVTQQRVQFVDVVPTLLEAAGLAPPDLDGRSFLATATDGSPLPRELLYFEMGVARAILKDRYKYIAVRYRPDAIARMKEGRVNVALDWLEQPNQVHSQIAMCYFPDYFQPDQLYDLSADPYEQRNLSEDPEHADVLRDLRAALAAELEQFEHPYDLAVPSFVRSEQYRRLVEKRLARGTAGVGWWPDDYQWPPDGAGQ
ncbi:MAG: sulfatase-like hydrolase/transferase [Candidatus Brocadiaceae bacterium]|jgi:arylsulfatase A-like enzyme